MKISGPSSWCPGLTWGWAWVSYAERTRDQRWAHAAVMKSKNTERSEGGKELEEVKTGLFLTENKITELTNRKQL